MSFLSSFESKSDGVNDTVEFVVRVAIVTLSAVILVVVLALVAGLFMPNDVVDSAAILEMVNPAFQTIIGAFVGLLGGLIKNLSQKRLRQKSQRRMTIRTAPSLSTRLMRTTMTTTWRLGRSTATTCATTPTATAWLTQMTFLIGGVLANEPCKSTEENRSDR
jgi:hypothetical protein